MSEPEGSISTSPRRARRADRLDMTRRAALGGFCAGFLGTIVIGGASGAILALVLDGFGAALVASVWGIVLAGILCSLPAGVFAMFECLLLATALKTFR